MTKRVKGEGTIFKNNIRDIWVGQYYDGITEDVKPKRKSVYGKTKLEVSKKLNDIMHKKSNSLYIEKNNITLIEVIEKNREEKYKVYPLSRTFIKKVYTLC